jgi:hypothetical protein
MDPVLAVEQRLGFIPKFKGEDERGMPSRSAGNVPTGHVR